MHQSSTAGYTGRSVLQQFPKTTRPSLPAIPPAGPAPAQSAPAAPAPSAPAPSAPAPAAPSAPSK
jgi:hypothetical protein